MLRDIQEVLAEAEYRVGMFYHNKGSYPGGRQPVQGAWPTSFRCISQADEALWELGDSYSKMGPRFREQSRRGLRAHRQGLPAEAYADEARRS